MKRLTVNISDEAFQTLLDRAARERRHVRDQAAILVEQGVEMPAADSPEDLGRVAAPREPAP
jgi:hypothetical protein